MQSLLVAAITSGVVTALIGLFGRIADHYRIDKNDRIREYRADVETLKSELGKANGKIERLEDDNKKLFEENVILKAKVEKLEKNA